VLKYYIVIRIGWEHDTTPVIKFIVLSLNYGARSINSDKITICFSVVDISQEAKVNHLLILLASILVKAYYYYKRAYREDFSHTSFSYPSGGQNDSQ
jgi:hypothetical protein